MSAEIKPGDEVQLRSGSPRMTVSAVSDGQCFCVWFHGSEMKGASFNPVTLTPAKESAPLRFL